jgi:hypothetical protein
MLPTARASGATRPERIIDFSDDSEAPTSMRHKPQMCQPKFLALVWQPVPRSVGLFAS